MTETQISILSYLHPYDVLSEDTRREILAAAKWIDFAQGHTIYSFGDRLTGLYIIESGQVAVTDENGAQVSLLDRENSFGERGLLRDGSAVTTAIAKSDCRLLCIPAALFQTLLSDHEAVRQFLIDPAEWQRKAVHKPLN